MLETDLLHCDVTRQDIRNADTIFVLCCEARHTSQQPPCGKFRECAVDETNYQSDQNLEVCRSFIGTLHLLNYINGNLLIEYDQSSRVGEQSQEAYVAETKQRCTINFLTINGHIQVRGSKDPESIVRTFRCIQFTLRKSHCIISTVADNLLYFRGNDDF